MLTLPSVAKLRKLVTNPRLILALVNAQVRLRGRVRVPLSVRLAGKLRLVGAGCVTLGESITLVGTIVPIEFVTHGKGEIIVGEHTYINYGTSISAHDRVTIGRHCLLGHYAFISDNNEHGLVIRDAKPQSVPVMIDDHVWIGSRVIILPGVHIGHHAVVGAGSVVTKDIPPYSLAVGNPARVIRTLDATSADDDQRRTAVGNLVQFPQAV